MTETGHLTFSIIVVSRHRPTWLKRCIMSLTQLDYPSFEIIVVADSASLDEVVAFECTVCAFDENNISAARNLGIAHAAGESGGRPSGRRPQVEFQARLHGRTAVPRAIQTISFALIFHILS